MRPSLGQCEATAERSESRCLRRATREVGGKRLCPFHVKKLERSPKPEVARCEALVAGWDPKLQKLVRGHHQCSSAGRLLVGDRRLCRKHADQAKKLVEKADAVELLFLGKLKHCWVPSQVSAEILRELAEEVARLLPANFWQALSGRRT